MKLTDYNTLAYEFAIRNPRVIELLGMKLTEEVVQELRQYGIDATSVYFDKNNEQGSVNEVRINSLQELNLDYPHLNHLEHVSYCPYIGDDMDKAYFKGYQKLIHPDKGRIFHKEELIEDAISRIKSLIESRGGKLNRLIYGTAFKHYDEITFFSETVHSIDPTTNTTATIRKDLSFISEWIKPEKYLQLLPQYISIIN